jgi:hypothetical protein
VRLVSCSSDQSAKALRPGFDQARKPVGGAFGCTLTRGSVEFSRTRTVDPLPTMEIGPAKFASLPEHSPIYSPIPRCETEGCRRYGLVSEADARIRTADPFITRVDRGWHAVHASPSEPWPQAKRRRSRGQQGALGHLTVFGWCSGRTKLQRLCDNPHIGRLKSCCSKMRTSPLRRAIVLICAQRLNHGQYVPAPISVVPSLRSALAVD